MRRKASGLGPALPVTALIACRAAATPNSPTVSPPPPTVALPAASAAPTAIAEAPKPPEVYAGAYQQLDGYLERDLKLISTGSAQYPTTFAAELIIADDNRGTALLDPQTLPATALYLDRLHALGIRGVKSAIEYPLFTPSFPHYHEYLEFYRRVAREIRQRGMTWTIQASILFANTPFSEFSYSFSGLSLFDYEQRDRAMVQNILDELQPDYLTILAEPDTAARLMAMPELNDPEKGVEFTNYILDGLDRGSTRICAGTGAWTAPTYARALAGNTRIDCVSIHIYPVDPQYVQNAISMAEDAHAHGKVVIVSEAWLYKLTRPTVAGNLAASPEAFKQDAFSFWAPLDQKFIELLARFADSAQVTFLSVFWSPFLFSYIDYEPGMEHATYSAIRRQANAAASQALHDGRTSLTGSYLQALIEGRSAR